MVDRAPHLWAANILKCWVGVGTIGSEVRAGEVYEYNAFICLDTRLETVRPRRLRGKPCVSRAWCQGR